MFDKQTTSTEINVDTAYRDFENVFPAVSICLNKGMNTDEIKRNINPIFIRVNKSEVKLTYRHFKAIQSYLFLNYLEPVESINMEHCTDLNETCGVDFYSFRERVTPKTCEGIIKKMYYLGKEENCTKYFEKFSTQFGICFVANSLYTKKMNGTVKMKDFKSLKMRYKNNENLERSLEIHYTKNELFFYQLIIHTPEELPDGRQQKIQLRKLGEITKVFVKTVEFHNYPDVKDESIKARNCRFPFERFDNGLPYSLNFCMYIKRVERELKTCNCTLPLVLDGDNSKICQLKDFACISNLSKEVKANTAKDRNLLMNYIGDCLVPLCITMEISKVGEYDQKFHINDLGGIKIEVINKPTLRYVRRVSFSRLDLSVQLGGIIGLFFGASVLSILEIFYLICRVCRFNVRRLFDYLRTF
ncbi:hypothetical protein PVAND_001778 [Polypedilum vanderplanki]|uniref:Uncharacterized protein n=1 Tax=Polypedilum vanderplanki TaxID=319348 RepID=A0A9J6BNZ1_POLVA|nr:hypothetical protein PVAND_001778 [Polypedilum vanderplanki]